MLNKTMLRLLRSQQQTTMTTLNMNAVASAPIYMMPGTNLLGDMQARHFALKKSTRINRRLRRYRADKIQRESSYYVLQECK